MGVVATKNEATEAADVGRVDKSDQIGHAVAQTSPYSKCCMNSGICGYGFAKGEQIIHGVTQKEAQT